MSTPSSQGSTCSFAGKALGRVTGWRAAPGTAVFVESTNITSTILGSGDGTRIVKQYDCIAIDPGTVEVTLYGCPPFSSLEIGLRGTVVVTFDGGFVSRIAYLQDYDVTGQVGQFLVGKASFKLSGASWT
jgi:hypothetical protein